MSKELGTRHRAAIGISEKSDCLVVVVSEETGTISLVSNGLINRYFDEQSLKARLVKELKEDENKLNLRKRDDDEQEKW